MLFKNRTKSKTNSKTILNALVILTAITLCSCATTANQTETVSTEQHTRIDNETISKLLIGEWIGNWPQYGSITVLNIMEINLKSNLVFGSYFYAEQKMVIPVYAKYVPGDPPKIIWKGRVVEYVFTPKGDTLQLQRINHDNGYVGGTTLYRRNSR